MLDIKLIRENPDQVREAIRFKHCDERILDQLLQVDEERRALRLDTETKQAEQNQASLKMRAATPEERDAAREGLRAVSETIQKQNVRLTELDGEYIQLMRQIPNLAKPDVPAGTSEKENILVKTVGEKPAFTYMPHHTSFFDLR